MYDKEVKRYKRRMVLSFFAPAISLLVLLIPISFFITIPLAAVLWVVIYFIMFINLVSSKIDNILEKGKDPEKYLYICYSLGMGGDRTDTLADLYRGRYEDAISSAEAMYAKSKLNMFKIEALFCLAHAYFEKGDMENLGIACDRIETTAAGGSRVAAAVLDENAFVISFYRSFVKKDYEACKKVKVGCETSKEYKSSPILLSRMMLYYGIACYRQGDTEEAAKYFNYIIGTCPRLYLSEIAKRYLNEKAETTDNIIEEEAEAVTENATEEAATEATAETTEAAEPAEAVAEAVTVADAEARSDSRILYENEISACDLIRQNYREKKRGSAQNKKGSKWGIKSFIIPVVCLVICIAIAVASMLPSGVGGSQEPMEAYEAIAANDTITRVVEIIPVNDEGDALCVYVSDGLYNYGGVTYEGYYSQRLKVAYLDCVEDGLYKYGVSSPESPQAELRIDSSTYKIIAPDLNKAIFFKIVDRERDIPLCISYHEFKIMEKTYYLCYMDSLDVEADEYSCEKVQSSMGGDMI